MRCSLWRHLLRWLVGGLLYGLLEIAYQGPYSLDNGITGRFALYTAGFSK